MVQMALQVLGPTDERLKSRRGDQPEGLGETLTGMGAGCVSLGILQLCSPLTPLSILFQNKVLTVDGVKVKLQVCPHGPGSISPAALGVQRWTKPLRGQSPSEDKAEEHPQSGAPSLSFLVMFPALGQPYGPFWLLCPLGRSLLRARGCSGHTDAHPSPAASLLLCDCSWTW